MSNGDVSGVALQDSERRQNEVAVRQAGGCRVSARAQAVSSQLLPQGAVGGVKGEAGGWGSGSDDLAINPQAEAGRVGESSDCYMPGCLPFYKTGRRKPSSISNSRDVHLRTEMKCHRKKKISIKCKSASFRSEDNFINAAMLDR